MNMPFPHKLRVQAAGRRTLLKAIGLAIALPFAHAAQSQEMALSTAINRAGRLRALSQRFAKAHLQMTLGVLPEKGQEITTTAQALIVAALRDLKAAQTDTRIAPAAGLLEKVEAEAKALLAFHGVAPSRKSAVDVAEQSDRMLNVADKLVQTYTDVSRVSSGKLINIAGRQRLASQRVAKLYFLASLGHGGEQTQRDIQKIRAEFAGGLEALSGAPLQTPNIRAHIDLGRNQWIFLDLALQGRMTDPVSMRNVATASERLLEIMNDLANEYEIILKEIA